MHQCFHTVTQIVLFFLKNERILKNLVNLNTGLDIVDIEVEVIHLHSTLHSL